MSFHKQTSLEETSNTPGSQQNITHDDQDEIGSHVASEGCNNSNVQSEQRETAQDRAFVAHKRPKLHRIWGSTGPVTDIPMKGVSGSNNASPSRSKIGLRRAWSTSYTKSRRNSDDPMVSLPGVEADITKEEKYGRDCLREVSDESELECQLNESPQYQGQSQIGRRCRGEAHGQISGRDTSGNILKGLGLGVGNSNPLPTGQKKRLRDHKYDDSRTIPTEAHQYSNIDVGKNGGIEKGCQKICQFDTESCRSCLTSEELSDTGISSMLCERQPNQIPYTDSVRCGEDKYSTEQLHQTISQRKCPHFSDTASQSSSETQPIAGDCGHLEHADINLHNNCKQQQQHKHKQGNGYKPHLGTYKSGSKDRDSSIGINDEKWQPHFQQHKANPNNQASRGSETETSSTDNCASKCVNSRNFLCSLGDKEGLTASDGSGSGILLKEFVSGNNNHNYGQAKESYGLRVSFDEPSHSSGEKVVPILGSSVTREKETRLSLDDGTTDKDKAIDYSDSSIINSAVDIHSSQDFYIEDSYTDATYSGVVGSLLPLGRNCPRPVITVENSSNCDPSEDNSNSLSPLLTDPPPRKSGKSLRVEFATMETRVDGDGEGMAKQGGPNKGKKLTLEGGLRRAKGSERLVTEIFKMNVCFLCYCGIFVSSVKV